MNSNKLYDIIAIGIGPFNLGLAALANSFPELSCLFFDSKDKFDWHPGMLIPGTRMQVPFYADLVTLVDPCNPFSYFNFLHAKGRMIQFGILENNYPLRTEYNEYCQWVAEQLPALQFGCTCKAIYYKSENKSYQVVVRNKLGSVNTFFGKHLVVGIGTVPNLPECANHFQHPMVFHSANYLFNKNELIKKKDITLIGSGQSAAEIFRDLLNHTGDLESISWYTQSQRIEPMDYSKFALEMSSPNYMEYFFNLPQNSKEHLLLTQSNLYKRINMELITDIYEQLYLLRHHGTKCSIGIYPSTSLQEISLLNDEVLNLQLLNKPTNRSKQMQTNAVVLATGYQNEIPNFLLPLHDFINWTDDGNYNLQFNYSIDNNNSLFIQNAELHTHGFNSADLGLGPYRNAVILNSILERRHFRIEQGTTFQSFENL